MCFVEGHPTFPHGPGFNDNVPNHGFPRFGRFVKRNGPDTEAVMTQNVIPVISVQSILYQLPYGAKKLSDRFFHDFSINYTIPYRTPKGALEGGVGWGARISKRKLLPY